MDTSITSLSSLLVELYTLHSNGMMQLSTAAYYVLTDPSSQATNQFSLAAVGGEQFGKV